MLVMVMVEPGRVTDEPIVSVRSEGGTTVDAIDMVRSWGAWAMLPWLPWLAFLVLLPGPALMGGDTWFGSIVIAGSGSPDSFLLEGMTLPLIVCAYSGSRE